MKTKAYGVWDYILIDSKSISFPWVRPGHYWIDVYDPHRGEYLYTVMVSTCRRQ
jgi:hypothetical protein